MPDSNIYARKGEVVTCENGHSVCEFTCNVFMGDTQDIEKQLKFFPKQIKPMHGEHEENIHCFCGASWFRATITPWSCFFGIPQFHFKEGWR